MGSENFWPADLSYAASFWEEKLENTSFLLEQQNILSRIQLLAK